MSLITANSIKIQKQLSKYSRKQEFAEAIHCLLYTTGLRIPKNVKHFLQWVAEMNGESTSKYGTGAFFYAEETIAEKMNCSISTVERAIRWLKMKGLLRVVPSWDYAHDKRGTAYKVFAPANVIKAMVNAIVAKDEQALNDLINTMNTEFEEVVKKLTGTVKGTVTGTETVENPPIPTDGGPKNSDHIIPNIKDPYKNIINNNNRFKENDCSSASVDKFYLRKETKEFLQQPEFASLKKSEKKEVGKRIQIFVHKYETTLQESKDLIYDACETWLHRKNEVSNTYAYLYTCIENSFLDDLLYNHGINVIDFDVQDEDVREQIAELRAKLKDAYLNNNVQYAVEEVICEFAMLQTELEMAVTVEKPKKRKKIIRKEMLPKWFEQHQSESNTRTEQEKKEQEMTPEEFEEQRQALLNELSAYKQVTATAM